MSVLLIEIHQIKLTWLQIPPLFMNICYACHNMFRFSDVYKKSRSYGVFVAAFLTYAASSVLHVSDHDSLSLCELQLKFIDILSSFSLKLWDLWFNLGRASWFIAFWRTFHVGYNYCGGNVRRITLLRAWQHMLSRATCACYQHVLARAWEKLENSPKIILCGYFLK